MPRPLPLLFLCSLCACSGGAPIARVCDPQPTAAAALRPGVQGAASELPNGRGLAPIGDLLTVGQNPLHLALSPDGDTLAVAEFGVNLRGVSVVRGAALPAAPFAALRVAQRLGEWRARTGAPPGAFLRGLAFSPDGQTLYAANTGADRVDVFARAADGSFGPARTIAVDGSWPADLALSADGAVLYVSAALSRGVFAFDAQTGALIARTQAQCGFPHALLLDGERLFVACEGADAGRKSRVLQLSSKDLAQQASFAVGKNPAALSLSADRATLFVAASDDDWIDRVDLVNSVVLEPFSLTPPVDAGGSGGARVSAPAQALQISPSALALARNGTLYVASPLLGAVLVVDSATGAQRGALPAGWRPSALLLANGDQTLFVANAKGLGTLPSPAPGTDSSDYPRGLLQRLSPIPSGALLAAATQQVARLIAQPAQEYAAIDPACERVGPLPARRGQDASASLIKHVIVVLKENKTFDSVFGDFAGAEASRDYLLFGERITPNQHALARQFCLADNFLLESEQSVEGHYWMAAQVTTDYFERIWAGPWGGGVQESPLPPSGVGPIDTPRNGFIWDQFSRAHVPYGSWGEFVGIGGDLGNHLDLHYVDSPANYLARPDTEKLPVFLAALDAGALPAFSFVNLQWDHTFGVRAGAPAPDYMVADNDRATGLLVEAVSHSQYWNDTLILITEDDPSGSADHVDMHRSFALVVSPYARRGRVSHVRGSMPSLAATWERALGVAPSSGFDAAAEPLWDCLTAQADRTPFTALPSNIAPHRNRAGDPGEPESRGLDLDTIDRADLLPALWKAMRPGEPLPSRGALDADGDADEVTATPFGRLRAGEQRQHQ